MSLYGVDLNLLVALDAMLIEEHVGRAATRIGLSQSAMSHILRRLRAVFDDPLFVRNGKRMQPTPRAIALRPTLRASLEQLEHVVFDAPSFVPASSTRTFRIACESYFSAVVLPRLIRQIRISAPHVKISLENVTQNSIQNLRDDDFDILIGVYNAKRELHRQQLFRESSACLVRSKHPRVKQRLTLQRYAETSHIVVSVGQRGPTSVDRILAEHGLTRNIALWVNDFLAAPLAVASSDLLFTCPARLANMFVNVHGLRSMRLPIELQDYEYSMLWTPSRQNDPAHVWLRDMLQLAVLSKDTFI